MQLVKKIDIKITSKYNKLEIKNINFEIEKRDKKKNQGKDKKIATASENNYV
jgi:hypothetical protein